MKAQLKTFVKVGYFVSPLPINRIGKVQTVQKLGDTRGVAYTLKYRFSILPLDTSLGSVSLIKSEVRVMCRL